MCIRDRSLAHRAALGKGVGGACQVEERAGGARRCRAGRTQVALGPTAVAVALAQGEAGAKGKDLLAQKLRQAGGADQGRTLALADDCERDQVCLLYTSPSPRDR